MNVVLYLIMTLAIADETISWAETTMVALTRLNAKTPAPAEIVPLLVKITTIQTLTSQRKMQTPIKEINTIDIFFNWPFSILLTQGRIVKKPKLITIMLTVKPTVTELNLKMLIKEKTNNPKATKTPVIALIARAL